MDSIGTFRNLLLLAPKDKGHQSTMLDVQQAWRKGRSYYIWMSRTCRCIYPLEEVSALKNRSTGEVVWTQAWDGHWKWRSFHPLHGICRYIRIESFSEQTWYSDQGPCQMMLQGYGCVSTIRPKHLDKGHWKDLEKRRPWDWNHENVGTEGRHLRPTTLYFFISP